VPAKQDDLLRAEPLRRDHPAQADRAVADDRGRLTRANLGRDRRVVAGAHHVGERQQRGQQCVIRTDRQDEQRPIGLGHPHEPNSYGFRPGRCAQDAQAAIFSAICRKPKCKCSELG